MAPNARNSFVLIFRSRIEGMENSFT